MGKLKILIISVLVLFTGCTSKPETDVYTVTYDSTNKQILYDGEYLYNYDVQTGILYDKRLPINESTNQSMYLISEVLDYSLSLILPGSYSGDYLSACGYINYLMSIGYIQDSFEATSDYYDTILKSPDNEVRVIIVKENKVKIFCRNSENLNISPPYINDKRKDN